MDTVRFSRNVINTRLLNGRTMTFEDIVNFMLPNRPEFIKLFYDEELGPIEQQSTPPSPPISFFKFVHHGVLEHVID